MHVKEWNRKVLREAVGQAALSQNLLSSLSQDLCLVPVILSCCVRI